MRHFRVLAIFVDKAKNFTRIVKILKFSSVRNPLKMLKTAICVGNKSK
jgi:hypothetical protein